MPRIPRPRWRRRPQDQRPQPAPEPPPPLAPEPPAEAKADRTRTKEDRARVLRRVALCLGFPLALLAGAHSYVGVYEYVRAKIPNDLAYSTPLLLDLFIVVGSCMYLAGAMVGRARSGWRLATHLAVAATIYTNAIAAPALGDVWIHVIGPFIWSGLIELAAKEQLGEWKATHNAEFGRVPRRLWLAGPHSFRRSWRATLRMHRTGHYDYRDAFSDLDLIDAAIRLTLRADVPDADFKVLHGWLRDGSLDPRQLLLVLENPGDDSVLSAASKRIIQREQIAAQEAERSERERRERDLTDERERLELARERAALAASERSEVASTERPQSVPVPPSESAPSTVPAAADRSTGRGRPWADGELELLRRLYDAFVTAQIARGETPSKPSVPDLLAAAKTGVTLPDVDGGEVTIPGRPELGLHDRPPVTVRKHVGPWWEQDPRNPEAAEDDDDVVRPLSVARGR